MKILISTLAFIFLAEAALVFWEFYIGRKLKSLAENKYKSLEPLLHKLAANDPIPAKDLLLVAQDPSLRCALFKILDAYNKIALFPPLYFTIEKAAEGYLVNWLEFPTELGNAPDEIKMIRKVTLENEIDYYVFKYKFHWPRWAKNLDWIIGVVGPYQRNSKPYDIPLRVFSRFNPLPSVTPEMEVKWVHKNINP